MNHTAGLRRQPLARFVLVLLVALAAGLGPSHAAEAQSVDVDPRLVPAWQALIGLRTDDGQDIGSSFALIAASTGVRLRVGRLHDGAAAGYYRRGQRIVVNRDLLGEDPTVLAALLAHELTHAFQFSVGEHRWRPCVDLEADAFWAQAYVWWTFWGGDPPSRTDLEESLTEVSLIAAAEGEAGLRRYVAADDLYQTQCGGISVTAS